MKHYPNLDLLRAIAVLCVVVCHLSLVFGNASAHFFNLLGYFGVVVFFVHTSLVLMMSLDRANSENPTAALFVPFMVRRCFRVYPLAICAVVAVYSWNVPLADSSISPYPD